MPNYVVPLYDATVLNRAAQSVADSLANDAKPDPHDLHVVNNWRGAHDLPLNGIHMTLRLRVKKLVSDRGLTAQRIKRLESISLKLKDRPTMKLSQMQDIGGCRAILPTIKDVRALQRLYQDRPVIHEALTPKDYIDNPVPDSGYRSLHLKFRFNGRESSEFWDGLKIEMQVRTMLQHRWATAVEAAGTMTGQLLKSRRGDEQWRRFFFLTSALFAHKERTAPVPGAPAAVPEILQELMELEREYQVLNAMDDYSTVVKDIESRIKSKRVKAHFFVMCLSPGERTIRVWEYDRTQIQEANDQMELLESTASSIDQVVKVSVSSLSNLQKAYPNYFLDTAAYIREIRRSLGLAPVSSTRAG